MDTKFLKSKYKFVAEGELEDLPGMEETTLFKELIRAKKNEEAAVKQKKDDQDIANLTKEIEEHRAEHLPDEVKTLQEEIKTLKAAVDEEIKDIIADKKDLAKGHSNLIKGFRQKQLAIMDILKNRES
jgi:hypothetical protein